MLDDYHPWVRELERLAPNKQRDELLLTSITHDQVGGPIANEFMQSITSADGKGFKKLRALVQMIVEQHMQPYNLSLGAKTGAFIKLHNKMKVAGGDLSLIAHQCMCDACATSLDWGTRSLASGSPNWEHMTSQLCLNHYDDIISTPVLAEPLVQGRDLQKLGLDPGPIFGKIIKKARDIQYGDITLSRDEILSHPDIVKLMPA